MQQRVIHQLMDLPPACMPSSLHPPCNPSLWNNHTALQDRLGSSFCKTICFLPWICFWMLGGCGSKGRPWDKDPVLSQGQPGRAAELLLVYIYIYISDLVSCTMVRVKLQPGISLLQLKLLALSTKRSCIYFYCL